MINSQKLAWELSEIATSILCPDASFDSTEAKAQQARVYKRFLAEINAVKLNTEADASAQSKAKTYTLRCTKCGHRGSDGDGFSWHQPGGGFCCNLCGSKFVSNI